MTLAEFAEMQARFGAKVVRQGDVFWRQVRPFFYRPLLPNEPVATAQEAPPHPSWCGYQYVTGSQSAANSTLNFLVYDDVAGYSLDALGHSRRKQIKKAARTFVARPVVDVRELKEQGHRAYMSFYERTKYRYLRERTDKSKFDAWADAEFRDPKTIVLGGYGPEGLVAVGVAYWVNRTLVYASLFSETEAMKKDVVSVLFHELRLLAARQPGISEILASIYLGAGNSRNRFYLDRGCTLVKKPARLHVNPVVMLMLKWFTPRYHAALLGNL